jgi:hypothetical protein
MRVRNVIVLGGREMDGGRGRRDGRHGWRVDSDREGWSTGHSMRLADVVGPKLVFGRTIHVSQLLPSESISTAPQLGFGRRENTVLVFLAEW